MNRRDVLALSSAVLGGLAMESCGGSTSNEATKSTAAPSPQPAAAPTYRAQALAMFILLLNKTYREQFLADNPVDRNPLKKFKTSTDPNTRLLYANTLKYFTGTAAQTMEKGLRTMGLSGLQLIGYYMAATANAGLQGTSESPYTNPDECPCQYLQLCPPVDPSVPTS